MPSGIARENGAIGLCLFHLVHCHQPLHTCLPESPKSFTEEEGPPDTVFSK